MKSLISVLVLTLTASFAAAHEGHDHDVPKGLTAPKGGVIRAVDETLVEVVSKGDNLKIYLYDLELKPKDAASIKLSAKAQKPREKAAVAIPLKASANMFEGTYDAKGIHRFQLILAIKDPHEDHEDIVKLNIEPKK